MRHFILLGGVRALAPSLLSLALISVACGGSARLVLEGPVTDQCVSAGLKGCKDLSEGALLYAEGKAGPGQTKLARGLHANAGKAAQLKDFADALQTVGQIPGAGQYVAPLQPAVRLIQEAAEQEKLAEANAQAKKEREDKFVPEPDEPLENATAIASAAPVFQKRPNPEVGAKLSAAPPQKEPSVPTSGYFMVAGNALAEHCRFVGTPKMMCLNEYTETTKIISDVVVSPGCSSDVVVTGRMAIDPEWAVYVPAGRGADVHGATLPLRPGRTLTVGVAYKSEDAAPDMRCGVTVVWNAIGDTATASTHDKRVDPRNRILIEALRKKVQANSASDKERELLRTFCQQLGDLSCSQ